MTEETEGREEVAKIQAALLQNELSDSLSLAEEFQIIARHMLTVYDKAIASHAPSEAAAQPTEGQRLYTAYKRDEIEHND